MTYRKILHFAIALACLASALALPGSSSGSVSPNVVFIHLITDPQDPVKNYFDPATITVKVGTKVRFVNVSGVHTATAYPDKIPSGATPFDSGLLTVPYKSKPWGKCTVDKGCYEVELAVPGTYEYRCIPHEALGMVGKIIVEE